jgi:hypothetical protein
MSFWTSETLEVSGAWDQATTTTKMAHCLPLSVVNQQQQLTCSMPLIIDSPLAINYYDNDEAPPRAGDDDDDHKEKEASQQLKRQLLLHNHELHPHYHCVSYHPGAHLKWRCRLVLRGENLGGYFATQIEAAKKYDSLVRENNLVKRPLNFPTQHEIINGRG